MESNPSIESTPGGVKSEILIRHTGLMVVRLQIPAGRRLPFHVNAAHVLVIVLSGRGQVIVNEKRTSLRPRVVVELMPGERHSIRGDEALEIVLVRTTVSPDEVHVDPMIDALAPEFPRLAPTSSGWQPRRRTTP